MSNSDLLVDSFQKGQQDIVESAYFKGECNRDGGMKAYTMNDGNLMGTTNARCRIRRRGSNEIDHRAVFTPSKKEDVAFGVEDVMASDLVMIGPLSQ